MNKPLTSGYAELVVWQKSIDFVDAIYVSTETYPKYEIFGLASQMRRDAVSIASNIAEGSARHSRRDFVRFLRQSRGSLAEIETQILISMRRSYMTEEFGQGLLLSAAEIGRMLTGLITSLRAKDATVSVPN